MIFGITYFGWILWISFIAICGIIIHVGDLPGQRRRRTDSRYCGPERRSDRTVVDALSQPIFAKPSITIRDKIEIHDNVVDITIPISAKATINDEDKHIEVTKVEATEVK